jgi:hypothetical protein
VIPDLAVCTFTIPAEIAIRDRIDTQILKAPEQPVFLGHADFIAHNFQTNQLLVRIEQIGRTLLKTAALFTHRQRQYNRSLLKFV